MPYKTYNNNDRPQLTNTTYSPISFSNSESNIMQSRFSISYFNKLMKISIALRNNAGTNDSYATYDTENQVSVYVSYAKAYMLYQMIMEGLINDSTVNNVCIELKNGLLKISNGKEFGVNSPCFSISYADESGNVNEVVYQTKTADYTVAYNYSDGQFSTRSYENLEISMFAEALKQYYMASTYAVAATVMEANMYKRNSLYELTKSIADKVGASSNNNGGGGNYNNRTFLNQNNNRNNGNSYDSNIIEKGYDEATFDSIAASMLG